MITIAATLSSAESWISRGSTSIVPPPDYWKRLEVGTSEQVKELRELSDRRLNEFSPSVLPSPWDDALALLDRMAHDGWLDKRQRSKCPSCANELNENEATCLTCPQCDGVYSEAGGVICETIYIRNLAPVRSVDWVVAIHGMKTRGAWQQNFSWHIGTTWGRSVPVAIYKYGIVIAGVIMAWRRRKLQHSLRDKLAMLYHEASENGFAGKPDVVAHSFGTWLFGHLLQDELNRDPSEQLRFGRIILTGCVLRPDFNWKVLKDAGLVEEILNHYGTRDLVVPCAHITIWDSGPSGRRGFDGNEVINIRAEGCGHSDLFSIERCVVDGKYLKTSSRSTDQVRFLDHSYTYYWRPFLTLPSNELNRLPDRTVSAQPWLEFPWPLRGTLFPIVALPLIFSLGILFVTILGGILWNVRPMTIELVRISGFLMVIIVLATSLSSAWRWLRGRLITRRK